MDINPLYPTVIPLTCPVTHYEWGAPGLTSLAARLYSMNSRACLSATKPYAEFVVSSHEPHTAVISTSPPASLRDYIGSQVIEVDPSIVQFYSRLYEDGAPFILKVISAATPTGVRVHPDDSAVTPSFEKSSFARLGSKSIMVFALGTTHVLVGFHPATKIVAQLTRVPEFADAIGRSHTDQFVHIVKSSKPTASHVHHIVATLLAQNPTTIAYCIRSAVSRLAKMPVEVVTDDDRMLIALANIFPDDPMCFVAYLLDRLQLNPGDAIFIPPTKPYCILNGDFVEVSEKTDSVYFAGLTATDRMRAGQFLQTVSFTNFSTEVCIKQHLHGFSFKMIEASYFTFLRISNCNV